MRTRRSRCTAFTVRTIIVSKISVGIQFNDFIANENFLNNKKYPDGRYNQYYILAKILNEKNINLEIFNIKRIESYKVIIFIGIPSYKKKFMSNLKRNFSVIKLKNLQK